MSFGRLIYHGGLWGGWAAFFGWLVAELLIVKLIGSSNIFLVGLVAALVGSAIGGGLGAVSGLANGRVSEMVKRGLPGLGFGFVGGLVGAMFGELLFRLIGFRALGWMFMGMAIGVGEGIYDHSLTKVRNGLLGGAIGGFIGGLLFDPIQRLVSSDSGMTSRAIAFTILGICIGLSIALVQVVMKKAWLSVEAGYRPGRQLILNNDLVLIGTAEQCLLPFLAFGAKGVEPRHAQVVKQPDGSFVLMDNQSRSGTLLNGQPLRQPQRLRSGDVFQIGVNAIRFSESTTVAAPTLPPPAVQPGAFNPGPAPQPMPYAPPPYQPQPASYPPQPVRAPQQPAPNPPQPGAFQAPMQRPPQPVPMQRPPQPQPVPMQRPPQPAPTQRPPQPAPVSRPAPQPTRPMAPPPVMGTNKCPRCGQFFLKDAATGKLKCKCP